jgi:hypothetical protein
MGIPVPSPPSVTCWVALPSRAVRDLLERFGVLLVNRLLKGDLGGDLGVSHALVGLLVGVEFVSYRPIRIRNGLLLWLAARISRDAGFELSCRTAATPFGRPFFLVLF